MRLERPCRCSTCHHAAEPGCREVQHAMDEVDKALADATARAYRHGHKLPQVTFYVQVPCWYSARKAKREGL